MDNDPNVKELLQFQIDVKNLKNGPTKWNDWDQWKTENNNNDTQHVI